MLRNRKHAAFTAIASVIEHLEKRSLLSAVVGSNGVLTVTGTNQDDSIDLSFNIGLNQQGIGGSYSVSVDNTNFTFPAANITAVVINGQDGNDGIRINGTEDDNAGGKPVNVTVNEGNGNDSIQSVLSETGFAQGFHLPGPSVSIIAGNGNDNVFVTGSTAAIVAVGDGNDTLQASANSDDLTATFTAGNGNDEIDGISPGGAGLVINAKVGTGQDTFNDEDNDPDISVNGSTTTGQNPSGIFQQISITGRVYEGLGTSPIGGARVFVDLNNDGIQDGSDPSSITDANGNYNLTFPAPESDDQAAYTVRIVAAGFTSADTKTVTANRGQGFSGIDFIHGAIPTASNPLIFGTGGSYRNQGNTSANVLDGNLSTFFDGPDASGDFIALDFGLQQTFSQISFAPRPGYASRVVGGLFQASTTYDFTNPVTLYEVINTPASGVLTTVNVSTAGSYRYIRYTGPANSYCNIAEMQFTRSPIPGLTAIRNGQLSITGTSGADDLSIDYDTNAAAGMTTGVYDLHLNGQSAIVDARGITSIVINSGDGADTININGDETNVDGTVPAIPLTITTGNGNDTVTIDREDHGAYNHASGTMAAKVTVAVGSGNDSVSIEGGQLTAVTVGNGNDTIGFGTNEDNLAATVTAGNGTDEIGAGAGVGSVHVTATVGSGQDEFSTSQSFFGSSQISATAHDGETPTINGNGSPDFTGQILTSTGTPVAGVTVFSDANNNGILDTGENFAITNSNGVYNLLGTPTDSKFPTNYTIRAIAPTGTTIAPATIAQSLVPGTAESGENFVVTPNPTTTQPVLIGTTGSYNNQGNTAAKAVDGNLSTFFDAPIATGGYVGLDYGSPVVIKQISFAPRSGFASRMVGGLFQGSNSSAFSSEVTLYEVTSAPVAGKLTTVNLPNTTAYRYIRYIGPANGYCNIAEMQFALATKLIGNPIGTSGSYRGQGNTIANAFDGNLNAFFDAPDATGDWVGLDLGSAKIATSVSFAPRAGFTSRMVGGEIQASNNATFTTGIITLATITAQPTAGTLTTLSLNNTTAYRYYRYIGPSNSYCNISELEFDG